MTVFSLSLAVALSLQISSHVWCILRTIIASGLVSFTPSCQSLCVSPARSVPAVQERVDLGSLSSDQVAFLLLI